MRVVLAEDLGLLRDGLVRTLTEHGFDIAAAVDNGPALRRVLVDEQPDVAVVDVRLPPSFTDEGLQAAVEARRGRPGLPVLVLSQYVEPLYARELLADGTGAIGYLLKDRVSDSAQFIDAVSRVAEGVRRWIRRSSRACSSVRTRADRLVRSPVGSGRCSS